MNKQELARKRNWFKFQLQGMYGKLISTLYHRIDKEVLTDWEKNVLVEVQLNIEGLIKMFDKNSRDKGLKVPEFKCWCGKEGKYESFDEIYKGKTCKKHKNIKNE